MIKRTTTTEPQADGSLLAKVRWTFLGIPFFGIRFSLDKPEAPDDITHTTRLGGRKIVMTRHGDPAAPNVSAVKAKALGAWASQFDMEQCQIRSSSCSPDELMALNLRMAQLREQG